MKCDILDYNGKGYAKLLHFKEWRVAVLNYIEELELENITYVECHLNTDEVFVLQKGEATLIFAEVQDNYVTSFSKIKLEKNKVYNVKAGTYHTHTLSKDCQLLIIEQEDTDYDNSPRVYLNEVSKKMLVNAV